MNKTSGLGDLVPSAELARASATAIEIVRFEQLVGPRRALVLGVPGAFTPVCTHDHLPKFVDHAASLRRSGYDLLVCVVPNDPFTAAAWQQQVDPKGEMLFLSDGNRALARALGLEASHGDYFLGHSNERYMMICVDGRITHLAVEPNFTLLTCTRPGDLPCAPVTREAA